MLYTHKHTHTFIHIQSFASASNSAIKAPRESQFERLVTVALLALLDLCKTIFLFFFSFPFLMGINIFYFMTWL